MLVLQTAFNKPSFDVTSIVVCPCENRRGRLTGYNLVAQGGQPNQQAIIGSFDSNVDRGYVGQQADALKAEFKI